MTDRSKTVVLLIDYDNLQICHSRDAPGTDLDLQALIALAQSYGTLVSARAYAEWNMPSERLAVYKAGIEPVFAPVMRPEGSMREGKSLADTVMVADGVDLLWTVAPDVFVLVTSDKDMIPLARIAKQRGAAVVVLGSDLTAIPLVELSNVFITYRQLLRELDRTTALDAPSGRAPARERPFMRESHRGQADPLESRVGQPRAARPPIEALQAPSGGRVAGRSSGASRPAISAPDAPAAALPALDEEPTALGDPSEGAATVTVEGLVRRRRRRGGRRRGGTGAASDQESAPELEAIAEAMGDAVAEPPITIAEATGEVVAGPETVGEREPAEVVDTPPPIRPRSSIRQSRSAQAARAPVMPPSFSEFGPPSSVPTATEVPAEPAGPSADEPLGAESEPTADAPAGSPSSPTGSAELSPEDQAAGSAGDGAETLAPLPTGDPSPVTAGGHEATGDGEDAGPEGPTEEQPKPARRRRTRTPR